MTISALTSGSTFAASQVNASNRLSNVDGANRSASAGTSRRAPPSAEGGAFIDAIASALSSVGMTASPASSSSSAFASSQSSSVSDGSNDTNATTDPAQALGAFLHTLMSSLHAQNGTAAGTEGAQPPGPAPVEGRGGRGRPGDIESDLQSLIQSLASDSSSSSASSASDSTSELQQSFADLLNALGGNTASSDSSSDSSARLSGFLQALSSNLSGASSSGNLINTSA